MWSNRWRSPPDIRNHAPIRRLIVTFFVLMTLVAAACSDDDTIETGQPPSTTDPPSTTAEAAAPTTSTVVVSDGETTGEDTEAFRSDFYRSTAAGCAVPTSTMSATATTT